MKIKRRSFLYSMGTGLLSGPSLWLPNHASAAPQPIGQTGKSRVTLARKKGVLQSPNSLDTSAVASMLDESMRALGDKKDPLDVWRSLFSPNDIVGIKVNALGGPMLSPHPELVYAIAERLAQAGVSPQKIFVWDRSERELKRAGFDATSAKGRAVVIATDSQGVGYQPRPEIHESIGSCFSRIISKACTALINVGILKDHDLSGTSVAMKNLFGLIHNPNRYHFDVHKDPYLPDLCLHNYVKNKHRLSICDGFRGQYDGGPAFKPNRIWEYGGLLISTDIVALDAVGARILEEKRKEMKLPSFQEAGREPLYIQLAEEKKIGWADPAHIELKEITT